MASLAACPAGAKLQCARSAAARPLAVCAAAPVRAARAGALVVRAERGGGFWSGVLVGGVVCGALGFVFAPQISRALLGDDDRLKLRWDDAADGGEVTKQNLADKIAQLNAAIDDVSSQLNTQSSSSATMSKDEAMA